MLQRFSVKAHVEGVGPIHHMVKAKDEKAVKTRLKRAYPGRKISSRRVVKRVIDHEGAANG